MRGSTSGMIGVCGLGLVAAASLAQQTVDWLSPVSGNWSAPSSWAGGVVPNNNNPNFFIARVLDAGVYTVSVDIDVDLSGFRFEAAGATLSLNAGRSLTTNGTNVFDGATIQGNAGASLTLQGQTTLMGGGTIMGVSTFNVEDAADIIDPDDWDLCDTCMYVQGNTNWQGTGGFNLMDDLFQSELVVASGGTLSVTGSGSRSITSTNAINSFVNQGSLVINFDNQTDTLSVSGATLKNQAGAKVTVVKGSLFTDALDALAGGALSGGAWRVEQEGTIDLGTELVTSLETTVELVGAGSAFDALASLETIGVDGTLAVSEGREFSTDPAAIFEVLGGVEIGAGSRFAVTGSGSTFVNLQGDALRGGRFVVGGELAVNAGAINRIGADVILDGAGRIEAISDGSDLLAGLSEIETAGVFTIQNGANFTTSGDLTLNGGLRVGLGTTLDVSGDLSAFVGGVLVASDIEVRGTLIADNSRVERVDARLIVGVDGQFLTRDGTSTVDGLAFLERIETNGQFGLVEGRALDLTVNNLDLAVAGRLILGASGVEGASAGSVLTTGDYTQEVGSGLEIGIMSTTDFGRIIADSLTFGSGAAGETAGVLTLVVDDSYLAALGDEFLIFELAPGGLINGAGFASIVVVASAESGLIFEQFLTSNGFGIRVVPAPAAAAVLMAGVLASRRRR